MRLGRNEGASFLLGGLVGTRLRRGGEGRDSGGGGVSFDEQVADDVAAQQAVEDAVDAQVGGATSRVG
jgi:hypothetical protein